VYPSPPVTTGFFAIAVVIKGLAVIAKITKASNTEENFLFIISPPLKFHILTTT
jgi:hypothetical protein